MNKPFFSWVKLSFSWDPMFLGILPWLILSSIQDIRGFSTSSVGKESACNTGDPSLTPGSGKSTGERIGHPLQYSWASLVAQPVKNLPAMQETWVWSLGWEDFLESKIWRTLQYSGLENSMDYTVHGIKKSWIWLGELHFTSLPTRYWLMTAHKYVFAFDIRKLNGMFNCFQSYFLQKRNFSWHVN